MAAVAAGARTLGDAFRDCAAREERVFLGDTVFYTTMERLARCRVPLVAIAETSAAPWTWPIALTQSGVDVLERRADHATLNGLDRWVGGVRLTGSAPAWRWDLGRGRIAESDD